MKRIILTIGVLLSLCSLAAAQFVMPGERGKVRQINPTNIGVPGIYTLQYVNNKWQCTNPKGATVNIAGTTTSGLQECINAMQTNKDGNFRAICPTDASGTVIIATTTVTFGPNDPAVYDLRGCSFASSATGSAVVFDSFPLGVNIDWSGGLIQCTAPGGANCIDFNPTRADPVFGGYGIGYSFVKLGQVYVTGCTSAGQYNTAVHFNPNGGVGGSNISAIYGTKIEVAGIDGFNGTYSCPYYGVLIDNPTNVYAAFGQNYIYIGYIQNFSQVGVSSGTSALTQATQALATNHWDIGSIGAGGAAVSGSVGIYTFGFLDQWYANVSINSGSLQYGMLIGATTANGNFFIVPQLAGTIPFTDNGTVKANVGYFNGTVHNF